MVMFSVDLLFYYHPLVSFGSEVSNLARKDRQELEQVSGCSGSHCSNVKSPDWVLEKYLMEGNIKGLSPVAGGFLSLSMSACVTRQ